MATRVCWRGVARLAECGIQFVAPLVPGRVQEPVGALVAQAVGVPSDAVGGRLLATGQGVPGTGRDDVLAQLRDERPQWRAAIPALRVRSRWRGRPSSRACAFSCRSGRGDKERPNRLVEPLSREALHKSGVVSRGRAMTVSGPFAGKPRREISSHPEAGLMLRGDDGARTHRPIAGAGASYGEERKQGWSAQDGSR
jgi:hypothetical protein